MGENDKEIDKDQDYEELIEKVSVQLERANFGIYVDLLQNPGRMIFLNLIAGIARGFGLVMGFAILGAVVLYILQRLVILNLPIIGGVISEVVKLIQSNVR